MAKDSTTAYHIAEAIEKIWNDGRADPSVRDITAEAFKDVPLSKPLTDLVRNQISGALRLLSELGSLGHQVTNYYYKLPVRNRARLIPADTVNRRKCVPLLAGSQGTAGVRKVDALDDPLFLEALGQTRVMTAGSVREFEKKQQQAKEGGLITKVLSDVRNPSWFDQALLDANPQLTLPLGKDSDG